MEYSLVIVGSAGHVGYVLSDLPRFPQVRFCAYAPSYAGEDVARYGKAAGSPRGSPRPLLMGGHRAPSGRLLRRVARTASGLMYRSLQRTPARA